MCSIRVAKTAGLLSNFTNNGCVQESLVTLRFIVRDPQPTNAIYGIRSAQPLPPKLAAALTASGVKLPGKFGGKRGMYFKTIGSAYKKRVATAAVAARVASAWPAEPDSVAHVRVSYNLYDYRGDTDGVRKALRDALEGILYTNDRVVEDGLAPLPIRDGNGRRIEVCVELLAVRNADEVALLRVQKAERMIAAARRRARRGSSSVLPVKRRRRA